MLVKAFCDGSAQPNPGIGTWGAVIYENEAVIARIGGYIGDKTTNNQAEYTALIKTMEYILSNPRFKNERVTICLDSELVVNQTMGISQCNNPTLKEYCQQAQTLREKSMFMLNLIGGSHNEAHEIAEKARERYLKISDLQERIKRAEGLLNERYDFLKGLPAGEKRNEYEQGWVNALPKYEALCDEFKALTGFPVWCKQLGKCDGCETKKRKECTGL